MTLTAAMEEAYASNPHEETLIETIELDHVSFAEPVRVANGVDEDVSLPLVLSGPSVLFRAIPFMAILPGQSEDGPTPMRLRIKDTQGVITPYLEAAVLATGPIEVTYRAYTTGDLTQPGDVIGGMFLSDVEQDPEGAEGQVTFQEIEMQAFPLEIYDEDYYPLLQDV